MKTIKYMMMAAVATLALGSCVSKKEYLAVQQQLQECRNGGMSLGKK
jgi:hypothetical protein